MKLFATEIEINELEAQLSSSTTSLLTVLLFAWYNRQRDAARSLELANKIEIELASIHAENTALTASETRCAAARLGLIRAESKWLATAIIEAEQLARSALTQFKSQQDWQGCADAYWLLAWIAIDAGKFEQRDFELNQMIKVAQRMGDASRENIAMAALKRFIALDNHQIIDSKTVTHFEQLADKGDPLSKMWANDFLGILNHAKGNIGLSLKHNIVAYKIAMQTGQTYFAIVIANNTADQFKLLNQHNTALDWMERGLSLARQQNWRRSIAKCLIELADNQRSLKNYSAAQEIMSEGLALLEQIKESRTYAMALNFQANLALDNHQYGDALKAFKQLQSRAEKLNQTEVKLDALRGQAQVLSYSGNALEAIRTLIWAINIAKQQGKQAHEIDLLITLGSIYLQHPNISKITLEPSDKGLHILLSAYQLALTIPDYVIRSEHYELLAKSYAQHNNFEQAYAMTQLAIKTKDGDFGQQVFSRVNALKFINEIQFAYQESEQLRQQALIEQKRVQALQKPVQILEKLTHIGQEITTHLNQQTLFEVLNKYVHALLSVHSFSIYLVDENNEQLIRQFGMEEGCEFVPFSIDVDHPTANSSKCFREQIELAKDFKPEDMLTIVPGTLFSKTSLYFPLSIGQRRLGVMSIESLEANAYSDDEKLIFRNLCAFAAIGFDNAATFEHLKKVRDQLVLQEKMAALGSIVAGVAEELNAPIANSLLMTARLSENTNQIDAQISNQTVAKSALQNYLNNNQDTTHHIIQSLHQAADLVMRFKQVSIDQTNNIYRQFDLKNLIEDIVATLQNQFNAKNIKLEQNIEEGILMTSFPGQVGQVFIQIIQNALTHAFKNRLSGTFTIMCKRINLDRIQIAFCDDGCGISDEHKNVIFDSLYANKLTSNNKGLGLNISYNIVKTLLQGDIWVEGEVNLGSTFYVELPIKIEKN